MKSAMASGEKDHRLLVIDAPHFYAGVGLEDGVVTRAAPILKYMAGWNVLKIRNYCLKKGWKLDFIMSSPR